MKILWKKCLAECKRRYQIIFEQRDIKLISTDYYNKKWISREETNRLFLHEKQHLLMEVHNAQDSYNKLLEGFNIGVIKNYQERS